MRNLLKTSIAAFAVMFGDLAGSSAVAQAAHIGRCLVYGGDAALLRQGGGGRRDDAVFHPAGKGKRCRTADRRLRLQLDAGQGFGDDDRLVDAAAIAVIDARRVLEDDTQGLKRSRAFGVLGIAFGFYRQVLLFQCLLAGRLTFFRAAGRSWRTLHLHCRPGL